MGIVTTTDIASAQARLNPQSGPSVTTEPKLNPRSGPSVVTPKEINPQKVPSHKSQQAEIKGPRESGNCVREYGEPRTVTRHDPRTSNRVTKTFTPSVPNCRIRY